MKISELSFLKRGRGVTAATLLFMAVLCVVFGDTRSAFAHEDPANQTHVTAKQASGAQNLDDTNAELAMRFFLLHMKGHREQITSDDEHSEFRNAMRTDDGVWKSGTTYVITVNRIFPRGILKAGEVITFHAKYPKATDKSLRHIDFFGKVVDGAQQADGKPFCLQDESKKYGNYICAVETVLTNQAGTKSEVISVVGFDHEEGDVSDEKLPDCTVDPEYFGKSGTDPDGIEFTRTSADMVNDRESLKNYLKTVEEHIINDIDKFRKSLPKTLSEEDQKTAITARFARLRPCWRDEPWKSGEIYFYLIRYAGRQYGVFNGLNPEFEDVTLRLYDGCIDVGRTVDEILQKQSDGFLEYYWSNPVKDDDLVVDDSGNPIRGLSTGTSVKLGYFLKTTFGGLTSREFVLGSGIYPEDQEYYVPEGGTCQAIPDDLSETARAHLDEFPKAPGQEKDGGGCAIASGDQGNLKVAGLNLLLVTLVAFFAVSRKSRAGGKF